MPKRGLAVVAEPERDLEPDESLVELVDVPAAVVCASCGDPGCLGCSEVDEHTQRSGVVAIVPWERPDLPFSRRLWATAQLTTSSCKSFFASLPEGELGAPLRFAVAAELFAVLGLTLSLLPLLLLLAPRLPAALLADPALGELALRAFCLGVPALALGMVAIHAVHGVGLDLGAERQGARRRGGMGLRFGLYACGWDLVTLPLGLLAVAVTRGPRAALGSLPLGVTAPREASRAYLLGVHGLDEAAARRAARFAALLATALVVVATLAALAAFAAVVLL